LSHLQRLPTYILPLPCQSQNFFVGSPHCTKNGLFVDISVAR